MLDIVPDLKVQYTREAANDLDRIWDYTEEVWSVTQAETYVSALRRTIGSLAEMPEMARKRTELSPPMFSHPSAEHLIFFQVDGQTHTVTRILGQRQNWHAILSD